MRTRRHVYANAKSQTNPQLSRVKKTPVNQHPPKPAQTPNQEPEITNLRKLYDDINQAPSFSAKINDFLRQHGLHSKFRRIVKKKFPRRRIIARYPKEIFMADLIEYPKFKVLNRGYVYILLLIDCFTKQVFVSPMKKKDQFNSAAAFESIFKEMDEFPSNLITDGGKEFFNSEVAKVFQNYGINHYKTPTRTKWKASMAERAIRTIKSRLQKYFHRSGKSIWINAINQVVENYNSTPHSSHGLSPLDVSDENRDIVYKKLYPNKNLTTICKLNQGDKVRILKEKTEFEKAYTQKWSDEIYTIRQVRQSGGVCWYKIQDHNRDILRGIWYYYQLNLVARYADQSGSDQQE